MDPFLIRGLICCLTSLGTSAIDYMSGKVLQLRQLFIVKGDLRAINGPWKGACAV